VIGSGFAERTDPAALVIGPTGVGLSPDGKTLYVADTAANRIAAIPNPLTRNRSALAGADVFAGAPLNNPLGLATAPNGDIITVNANDGNAVETTPEGTQVATLTLDAQGSPPGAGDLFGLAIGAPGTAQAGGLYFVDDFNTPGPGANTNSLNFRAPTA
jgi:sugar lactone lactonase YvrE